MRVCRCIFAGLFALLPVAVCAQVQGQGQGQGGGIGSQCSEVQVNVRIYAPQGGPLQETIRFTLVAEDGHRPPEDFYTDSRGIYNFSSLRPLRNYTILVPGDGRRFGDTRHSFIAMCRQMSVPVQLSDVMLRQESKGPSVSLYSLKQDVPRAARREYDQAIDQLEKDDATRALKHLERAVQLFPDYVEALNELAVLQMKAGELAAAEQNLRHALSIDAAAVLPLLNLGLVLMRQEKYADAIEPLEKATQLAPANARAYMLLGSAQMAAGRAEPAELSLQRAYELGGKNMARANLELARLYARRSLYDRAVASLSKYLDDVPDDPNSASLKETLERLRAAARGKS